MSGSDLRLTPVGRFPGKRVLTWHRDGLYVSEGYSLWRWTPADNRWDFVARYRPDWTRRLSSASRLGSRLRRDGFHAVAVLPDGALVATLPKAIAICPRGQSEFHVVWRITRGTRPLNLAVLPGGAIYWGEYFDNPRRDEVHVYGSLDGGRTWQVVYTFPRGKIRHVHSITYDSDRGCLWMCTGDYGTEAHIMRVSPDWSTVESLLVSGQQARTVRPIPTSRGLYFATDSELEQNYIYCMTPDGALERLSRTTGPSMWGCQVGSTLFFSTAVEPSKVNRGRTAGLYGSRDGESWSRLVDWKKDSWHWLLFQYGNVILPSGTNHTRILAATGMAVEGEDGVMHAWDVGPQLAGAETG